MQREAKSKAQVLGHGFIAGLGSRPLHGLAWPHLTPSSAPSSAPSCALSSPPLRSACPGPAPRGGFVLQILAPRRRMSARNLNK
jgi:hypothetical protein